MIITKKLSGVLQALIPVMLLSMLVIAGRSGAATKAATMMQATKATPAGPAHSRRYEKYVRPAPIEPGKTHGPLVDLRGTKYNNTAVTFRYRLITAPNDMVTETHQHKFTEFLMFYGSDPKNISDFGGEIEFSIGRGKDAEKYVITSPTVLYLPAGLPHCPLRFKKINKTVAMVVLALTPDYATSDSQQ